MSPAFALALCCSDLLVLPIQATDLDRFPMACIATEARCDAERHRGLLKTEREAERTDVAFWGEWLEVSDHQCAAWQYLDQAHHPERWDSGGKLTSLSLLRDLIGPADYYAGRMPPTWSYAPRLWAPWIR